MRTTIPATKRDVAMATSCILKDASTIWGESTARKIEKTKQRIEIINPADSGLKGNPSHAKFPLASKKPYEPTILITNKLLFAFN